ncbi:SDR family NAD(P)-dependent oxidoreductase [Novosphingobium album (ex Liu et al. 2023)]|uniref:SDR family NAD(P)-dependent oxidoreductase n=1 Tax=Novosphingobium album (ex Liu et al. 2023) TaxID=3031130 RepID=A0ABT5WR41_9SPHN|nr:SDR family oxidoreductase [Novosphingobium album (ex Liu et al. 2023)]MDE8652521.1 SDR family NAD(P)-dependent oxidoreductase [Novosphingobium album (ex Liu et al. 2023)]
MVDIPISAMPRMDGQVAIVTGAAGGIGSEVVRTFAAAGATVIATDLGAENPFEGAERVHYIRYDVTSAEDTASVVSGTLAAHGRIDVLVACAGAISNLSLADASDEEWEKIWRVNTMGVVNPVRAIYPVMVDQGYGKMVALGSIAAKIGGVASGPAYVAAKSAVHGLMKWVAKSGAKHGVYANIIAPGPVETPMWQKCTDGAPPPASGPTANSNVPLGRYGQPEDIAQGILFLCSPQSNWITGTTLDVNGGMLMD